MDLKILFSFVGGENKILFSKNKIKIVLFLY